MNKIKNSTQAGFEPRQAYFVSMLSPSNTNSEKFICWYFGAVCLCWFGKVKLSFTFLFLWFIICTEKWLVIL